MKVMFCIDDLTGGGRERRLVQLIKRLHETTSIDMLLVLFSNAVQYDDIFNTNCRIEIIDKKSKNYLGVYLSLLRIVREFGPNIIHCWSQSFAFYLNLIRPIYSFKYVAGFIATSRRAKPLSFERVLEVISFLLADKIISNSFAGLKAKRAPIRKSLVIYNGVNVERFGSNLPPEVVRESLGVMTPYTVIMIARIHPHKDIQMFINVAYNVLKVRNDITFLLVGDGPLLGYYKGYLETQRIEKVLFTGFRKDVENIINMADISVLCTNSEICPEGISNSLIESMLAGKPVIATSGGGTNEVVQNGYNGYLVAPHDIENMTNKILMLIENSNLRAEVGANAMKDVKQRFQLSGMVDKYVDLYENLISKNPKFDLNHI
jgi:glycosyltransferase involved in cell wall biosynthesis